MKKKGYKQMQRRLLREKSKYLHQRWAWETEKERREHAEEEAKFYRERFRKFGSNVETVEPDNGRPVQLVKWELKPERWGTYSVYDASIQYEELMEIFKQELTQKIVEGLIERNLIQIIIKDPSEDGGPLSFRGTYGAKLYVVPWEQMPHDRRIELMQYAENTLAWPKYVEK